MKPFNAKVEICNDEAEIKTLKITFLNVSSKLMDFENFEIKNFNVNLELKSIVIHISDTVGIAIEEGNEECEIFRDFEKCTVEEGYFAFFINDDSSSKDIRPKQSGNGGVVGVTSC
ncbi:hypothetical protein [Lacinutrix mariniflava]|uniref:hypothetical protein n=1 Tax=Lacinutrix mariniflava TaxID=342955 RepID=UPI0006E2D50D|nr:hypothetical protein [Lacinutrix mariniflava]